MYFPQKRFNIKHLKKNPSVNKKKKVFLINKTLRAKHKIRG